MSDQQIELGYGKVNLSETTATFGAMRVAAPFTRDSAVNTGRKIGSTRFSPVGNHSLFGSMQTQRVEHPNGTIILLQASWNRHGGKIREGGVFVRLRQSAPLYRISSRLPTGASNTIGDKYTVFHGNGDILNDTDLGLAGLKVGQGYLSRYMNLEELEECFEISRLSEGSSPRPSVVSVDTPTGTQLREMAALPRRRLIMRR